MQLLLGRIKMNDVNDPWDDSKASANWEKRRIAFEMARKTFEDSLFGLAQLGGQSFLNHGRFMTKIKHDWSGADAMTDEDIHAAALGDPDAQPLTPDDFNRMKRTPQVKVIRRALGLSQDEFSLRFHIPIGTLRDWEQGRKDPDAAARAYLVVIGRNPAAVREALHPSP